jgi:hypothetical protein
MSQSAKGPRSQDPIVAPRRNRAAAVGEAALAHAAAAFGRAGFADPSLLLRWPEIMGPAIARVAQPLRWQEGQEGAVLTLKCEPGAIVFLQHETRTLVERLNAYLGHNRIARIRLVAGTLADHSPPPDHPHGSLAPKSDATDGRELSASLDSLERLRDRLKR